MSSTELTTLSEALHYGRHASGCVIIDWRTPRSGRHRTLDHDGHECEPWMFDMVRPGDSLQLRYCRACGKLRVVTPTRSTAG